MVTVSATNGTISPRPFTQRPVASTRRGSVAADQKAASMPDGIAPPSVIAVDRPVAEPPPRYCGSKWKSSVCPSTEDSARAMTSVLPMVPFQ